jgi:hypothetical protein
MRNPRVILGVAGAVFAALAVMSLFRTVSASAVAGGAAWPCGSVVRPVAAAPLAEATPDEGRVAAALDQAACSAARDRQLGRAVGWSLPAVVLGVAFAATSSSAARRSRERELVAG